MHKGIGNLPAHLVQIPPRSASRDPQEYSSFLLFISHEIDQFQDLELIGKYRNDVLATRQIALGTVTAGRSVMRYPPSRPGSPPPGLIDGTRVVRNHIDVPSLRI